MTRLRASTFTLRATADKSRFGAARLRLRASAFAPRLRQGLVVATAVALAVTAGSANLLACPVCFGAEETPLIDGAKLGILMMLGITFAVQGGFVGFFLYLRRRAKRMAEVELDDEWSELQKGSRTS
jgi:hypothetical protein